MDPDPARWGEIATNFMAFEPVVDGTILTASPLEQLGRGVGANVELLIGTNADEQNFFLVPGGLTDVITGTSSTRCWRTSALTPRRCCHL